MLHRTGGEQSSLASTRHPPKWRGSGTMETESVASTREDHRPLSEKPHGDGLNSGILLLAARKLCFGTSQTKPPT